MKTLIVLSILLLSAEILSQSLPPAATNAKDKVKNFAGWKSVRTIPDSNGFVSLEGGFKIALPRAIQGYGAISPKQTGSTATGQEFTWKFAEAEIHGLYLDFPDSTLTGSPAELDEIAERLKNRFVSKRPTVKLLTEGRSASTSPTHTFYVYDLGADGIRSTHLFLHGKRLYQFDASLKDREHEDRISRVMATFFLISSEDIDAAIRKIYEDLIPPSLPQSPRVARATTDLEDEGLKGKVKKVVVESEDRSGTWGVQGRKISSADHYDENGALTQRDSYDSRGKPFQITVYGYVDGKRVSNSRLKSYESDPPLMAVAPRTGSPQTSRKNDPRFEYSFEFKSEKGKLIERQMVYSNGRKGMRYVYKHSPGQVEELVYTEEGKLNQRYVSIIDATGNVIEQTDFGVVNFEIYGDRKYRYSYEFDTTGNWTKQIASRAITENGVVRWEPSSVSYRTILYY